MWEKMPQVEKGWRKKGIRLAERKTSSPMMSTEQTGFLVLITDGTEIASHDLEIGILSDIIPRHLEHAEMEIGYRAEGSTCDEYDGGL